MARPTQHKPEAILAAATAVFAREGVEVSTSKIATAAGVSNGTLYNHFPTKQALIDALYLSIKRDLGRAAGTFKGNEPIRHRIHQVWQRWLDWARRNRQAHLVVNLLHQSGLASQEAQKSGLEAVDGPVRVLHEAEEQGLLVDLPLEYLAAIIQQHLDQAIAFDLRREQADLAFNTLWNAITHN